MKLHHLAIVGLTLLGTVSAARAVMPVAETPVEKNAVTATGTAPARPARQGGAAAAVHLNTATAEQLETLKGVGPATAQAIIAWRKQYGPFKSVDQLLAIKGIGPTTLEKMRDQLTL